VSREVGHDLDATSVGIFALGHLVITVMSQGLYYYQPDLERTASSAGTPTIQPSTHPLIHSSTHPLIHSSAHPNTTNRTPNLDSPPTLLQRLLQHGRRQPTLPLSSHRHAQPADAGRGSSHPIDAMADKPAARGVVTSDAVRWVVHGTRGKAYLQ
jgi:hypothetical protein